MRRCPAERRVPVPKFYFEIRLNKEVRADHDGVDLPNIEAARREAVMTIASIAADEIPQDGPLNIAIRVYDANGTVVFRTRVTFDFDDADYRHPD